MLHSTLINNILKHFTMQEKGYGKSKMYHLYLIQFKEHIIIIRLWLAMHYFEKSEFLTLT